MVAVSSRVEPSKNNKFKKRILKNDLWFMTIVHSRGLEWNAGKSDGTMGGYATFDFHHESIESRLCMTLNLYRNITLKSTQRILIGECVKPRTRDIEYIFVIQMDSSTLFGSDVLYWNQMNFRKLCSNIHIQTYIYVNVNISRRNLLKISKDRNRW